MKKDELVCRICGSDLVSQMYDLGDREILRCGRCGTGRTSFKGERFSSQERFDKERWVETREILSSFLTDEANFRYRKLQEYSPGKRLIEIGAGTGEFLKVAYDSGHKVTGLDVSASAISQIRAKMPELNVKEGKLQSADFSPGDFDVVAAFHVLEHIEDLKNFLNQIAEVLKANGLLYVFVPNLDSYYRLFLGKRWWGFAPEHVWHFSAEGLGTLLKENGFELIELGSSGIEKYSLWPVLPLLYGNFLQKLGNLLAPRTGRKPERSSDRDNESAARFMIKKTLIHIYMGYRRLGSLAFYPLFALAHARGRGSELFAVARKIQ